MTPRIDRKERPRGVHATAPAQGLHLCRGCDSGLVYPRAIEKRGKACWKVELRCPECGWTDTGTFGEDVIEEFEKELDRGYAELESALADLVKENMAEYADRFALAIAADAIHPIDF